MKTGLDGFGQPAIESRPSGTSRQPGPLVTYLGRCVLDLWVPPSQAAKLELSLVVHYPCAGFDSSNAMTQNLATNHNHFC